MHNPVFSKTTPEASGGGFAMRSYEVVQLGLELEIPQMENGYSVNI